MGKGWHCWLGIGLSVCAMVPACLSEVLIDNYDDHSKGGAAAPDNSNAGATTVPPPVGSGGANSTWSTPSSSGLPNAAVAHQQTLHVTRTSTASHAWRPLLTMSPSGEVTFVSPTEGAPGPSFEVYSKTSFAPERSRIFPDEPAPHAMAIDASGSVILVGGFANSGESVAVSFGGPSIAMNGNGYYLIKLNSDWDYLFGLGVAMTDNVQVTAVATDADNHIYVALNLANEFGMVGPQIVAYDEQLRELYRTPVEPLGQDAAITSLAVSAAGELLVTGNFVGQLRFGNLLLFASTNLSSNSRNLDGWVARCKAATGACDYVASVGGPLSDQVTGYAQDSLGGLRAFATLTGPVVALGAKIAASDFGSPILFGTDGATVASWSAALGDWGVADTLTLAEDGTSYVSGRTIIRDNTGATNQQVFAAEVERDGTISSYYPIASPAQGKTVIAVGAERLIWLAWVAPVTNASRLTFDSVTLMRLEPK